MVYFAFVRGSRCPSSRRVADVLKVDPAAISSNACANVVARKRVALDDPDVAFALHVAKALEVERGKRLVGVVTGVVPVGVAEQVPVTLEDELARARPVPAQERTQQARRRPQHSDQLSDTVGGGEGSRNEPPFRRRREAMAHSKQLTGIAELRTGRRGDAGPTSDAPRVSILEGVSRA